MTSKKKLIAPEFFAYAEKVAALRDEDFAEEVLSADLLIESFIDLVKSGSAELPSREELSRACLCLLMSIEKSNQTKDAWDLVWRLSSHDIGLSFYSIAPKIEEIQKRAITSWEKLSRSASTPLDDRDIPF